MFALNIHMRGATYPNLSSAPEPSSPLPLSGGRAPETDWVT